MTKVKLLQELVQIMLASLLYALTGFGNLLLIDWIQQISKMSYICTIAMSITVIGVAIR